MIEEWLNLAVMLGAAAVAALLAAAFLARANALPAQATPSDETRTQDAVFLFDDETLVDATAQARALLSAAGQRGDAWRKLMAFVTPRFPDFETRIHHIDEIGRIALVGEGDDPVSLVAEWRDGLTRITLAQDRETAQNLREETLGQRALEAELQTLRATAAHAPLAIWRQDATGRVIWANTAYHELASDLLPENEELSWPLPRVFPDIAEAAGSGGNRRQAATRNGNGGWYECVTYALERERLCYAVPADATVRAEASMREFVQTLSKTFAHLSIGLAIFDRQRQLQLFNPALTDLTGLPVQFLASRPRLFAFLDALRENRTIPEPKDYKSWRNQMIALEKAAASGQYEEVWTLPEGQTYRVTGRPHPDGAVALLFEDISDEMTLTRRFRAELELGQSVIDGLDTAVAVFSPSAAIAMSNAAYARLWGRDPGTALAECTAGDAVRTWQAACSPSVVWPDILARIEGRGGEATGQRYQLRLADGRALDCRLSPLPRGATMVVFAASQSQTGTEPVATGKHDAARRHA